MSKEENTVYRELQKNLDRLPVGYPPTESGIEISVLKHLFTPLEAKIASKLNILPESVTRIYWRVKKLGISKAELKQHLDDMDKKGCIFGITKGKSKYYRIQVLAVGMFEFQINRVTKEFMVDVNQYIDEGFADELTSTGVYQSRIIPVEKGIPYESFVYSYDNVRHIINKAKGKIAIANCICRTGYDKLGKSCKVTDLRESCLVFQSPADYYINHGFARPIEKDEALEVLDKAEKDGLILQVGNSQRPNFICTCCGCCCSALISAKTFPQPSNLYLSNYIAEIDGDLCIGCKKCIDRCQMDALTIENNIASVDNNYCIGCGLCVSTCSSKAIELKKTNRRYKPPKGSYRLFLMIMKKRMGRWKVFKTILGSIPKFNYLLKK